MLIYQPQMSGNSIDSNKVVRYDTKMCQSNSTMCDGDIDLEALAAAAAGVVIFFVLCCGCICAGLIVGCMWWNNKGCFGAGGCFSRVSEVNY